MTFEGGPRVGRDPMMCGCPDQEVALLQAISRKSCSKSRKAELTSLVTPNAQTAEADICKYIYIYICIFYMYIYIHICVHICVYIWICKQAYLFGRGQLLTVPKKSPGRPPT